MRISILIILLGGAVLSALAIGGAVRGQEEKKDVAKEALEKAVALGKKLFADKELGKADRACAQCHDDPKKPNLALAGRVGDYPKYDKIEKRVVTLGTKVNQMISRMLKGEKETLGSDRLVAIEAYLMELARNQE